MRTINAKPFYLNTKSWWSVIHLAVCHKKKLKKNLNLHLKLRPTNYHHWQCVDRLFTIERICKPPNKTGFDSKVTRFEWNELTVQLANSIKHGSVCEDFHAHIDHRLFEKTVSDFFCVATRTCVFFFFWANSPQRLMWGITSDAVSHGKWIVQMYFVPIATMKRPI